MFKAECDYTCHAQLAWSKLQILYVDFIKHLTSFLANGCQSLIQQKVDAVDDPNFAKLLFHFV